MAIHDDFDESIGFGFKDVGVILNNAKGRSFGWRRRNFISKIVPRGDFFAAQHEVLKEETTAVVTEKDREDLLSLLQGRPEVLLNDDNDSEESANEKPKTTPRSDEGIGNDIPRSEVQVYKTLACMECRIKKTKCSREVPSCQRCRNRWGVTCIYPDAAKDTLDPNPPRKKSLSQRSQKEMRPIAGPTTGKKNGKEKQSQGKIATRGRKRKRAGELSPSLTKRTTSPAQPYKTSRNKLPPRKKRKRNTTNNDEMGQQSTADSEGDISKETKSQEEIMNKSYMKRSCNLCRSLKRKCSREVPTCSRCSKRGVTCTYPDEASQSAVPSRPSQLIVKSKTTPKNKDANSTTSKMTKPSVKETQDQGSNEIITKGASGKDEKHQSEKANYQTWSSAQNQGKQPSFEAQKRTHDSVQKKRQTHLEGNCTSNVEEEKLFDFDDSEDDLFEIKTPIDKQQIALNVWPLGPNQLNGIEQMELWKAAQEGLPKEEQESIDEFMSRQFREQSKRMSSRHHPLLQEPSSGTTQPRTGKLIKSSATADNTMPLVKNKQAKSDSKDDTSPHALSKQNKEDLEVNNASSIRNPKCLDEGKFIDRGKLSKQSPEPSKDQKSTLEQSKQSAEVACSRSEVDPKPMVTIDSKTSEPEITVAAQAFPNSFIQELPDSEIPSNKPSVSGSSKLCTVPMENEMSLQQPTSHPRENIRRRKLSLKRKLIDGNNSGGDKSLQRNMSRSLQKQMELLSAPSVQNKEMEVNDGQISDAKDLTKKEQKMAPGNERPKMSRPCLQCRKKKKGCSRDFPVCERCKQGPVGGRCEYPPDAIDDGSVNASNTSQRRALKRKRSEGPINENQQNSDEIKSPLQLKDMNGMTPSKTVYIKELKLQLQKLREVNSAKRYQIKKLNSAIDVWNEGKHHQM